MKKKDRKALGEYCRDLADKLELRDWTITVTVDQPTDPERNDGKRWAATSESTPGRKHVEMVFDPDCRAWRLEALRATVAHELIHVHFAPLIEMVREELGYFLAAGVHTTFNAGATRWLEYGVDAMADATAKHLPLIAWPD